MTKLTRQEVFKIIKLIDLGYYKNSLLDFFEELNESILNVTEEEKDLITKFIKEEISSWNNTSYEYQEYNNFLYKNIYISSGDETIIEIYETNSDDNIRKITTLTLLPSYTN